MSAYATFDAEMRAALAAGEPNLDNTTDPDVIGTWGLEWDGDEQSCSECEGEGGWLEPTYEDEEGSVYVDCSACGGGGKR